MAIDNRIFIENLELGYTNSGKKQSILSGLNLFARAGELIALVGKNGIGKSTLLRSIVRLQKQLSGKIFISGKELTNFSRIELAKKISFVSTEIINVTNLRVFDVVALGRFPYSNWFGKVSLKDKEIIEEALEMTGMQNAAKKNINEISDGERQRVMISRTLAQDTDIIILDEPTAFLDLPNKYEIIHILNNLAKTKNKTVIFSSHDLNIVIRETDKIWLMINNSVLEGAPEDLIINDSFGKIFNNTNIFFDNQKGDFLTPKVYTSSVFFKKENKKKEQLWTIKALERLGISLSDKAENELKVNTSDGKYIWQIEKNGKKIQFDSIYDLSLHLKKFLN